MPIQYFRLAGSVTDEFCRQRDEDTSSEEFCHWYKPYIVTINSDRDKTPHMLLQMERTKQVMVQFLWRKQATFEKNYQDKFLLLIHEECKKKLFKIIVGVVRH